MRWTSRFLVGWLLVSSASVVAGQSGPRDSEQPRYKASDYERQSERVRDRDLKDRVRKVPGLTTRSLRQAVEAVRSGRSTVQGDLGVVWGEFLSADGLYFVALEVSLPLSPGAAGGLSAGDLSAGDKVHVFGALTGADGKEVLSFDFERALAAAPGRLYAGVPLPMEPGEYGVVVGISTGRTPRRMATLKVAPAAIDPGAFGLSRLILSDHLFALPTAQHPDEPFAFGGIKVVPRPDSTFRAGDEVWLFVVVRSPGRVDGQPRFEVRVTLEGPAGEASAMRRLAVGSPVPSPLLGFTGQWGVGFTIPLRGHRPGSYRLTLEITDAISKETRASSAELRIID